MFGGTGNAFGQKPGAAAGTGFSFPQSTAAPQGTNLFGGGTPTAAPAVNQTGQLGQQQPQGFSGFSFPQVQQQASQPGAAFQLPTATSTGAPNVSLFGSTLGQAKPATMGFGSPAPASAVPATMGFGTPAAAPATFGFGSPASVSTAPATLGFGSPAPATAAPATLGFGSPAPASAAPAVMGFGTPAPAATAPATFGFGSPAPASTAPATLGFGTPALTASPGLSFGLPQPKPAAAPTSAAPGLSFGFGTPATTTATSAAPTMNFGLGNNAATAVSAVTGLATSAAPAPITSLGFNLGAAAPPATAPSLSFPAASSAPSLSFGLGTSLTTGAASTPAPLAFGLPAATTAGLLPTSAPSALPTLGGLGGATSFNIGKGISLTTKPDQLKANPLTSLTAVPAPTQAPNYKDDLIPQELMQLVEGFKTFVKEQKSSSSVVNRASLKQITKVTEDAELLKRMTMQLERTVIKNKALNKKLREDVARGIQDSEVVQRLSIDPRGFPSDNSLAFEYFRNIVDRFQLQAESLTVELKNMEKHIVCKLNPSPFTPEELSAIMKQLHECFVALAGRYQSIHSSVTSLKLEVKRKKDPWYSLNSFQTNTLLR